jgi:hypothetical protein
MRDVFYIEDFATVQQQASAFNVRFFDDAVADFFDRCVDDGLVPQQFGRIWCHTHPGASVTPTGTDEVTFDSCFGQCDWSVMFILGRTGRTYARLAFHAGPGGNMKVPVGVDWDAWPEYLVNEGGTIKSAIEEWEGEYASHIQILPDLTLPTRQAAGQEKNASPAQQPVSANPDDFWLDYQPEEMFDEFNQLF